MAPNTSMLIHKRDFIVVYDYGMGGVWAIISAYSSEEIRASFPELQVFEARPDWMSDEQFAIAAGQRFDIEKDTPPEWLIEAGKSAS